MQRTFARRGDVLAADAGRYVVQLSITDAGTYRVETLLGGTVAAPVEELTRSFPDRDLARHVATVIWATLRNVGATVADAQAAVVAFFDDLIDRLAQNPSGEVAEAVAEFQTFRAGYATDQTPAGLAGLAHLADNRRRIRGSLSQRRHKPLSEPLRRIIDTAALAGGTVRRSKAANDRQLRALWAAGYGDLNYRPGMGVHKVVESFTLNPRGWVAARSGTGSATVGNRSNFDNGQYPPCAADAQDMNHIPGAVA